MRHYDITHEPVDFHKSAPYGLRSGIVTIGWFYSGDTAHAVAAQLNAHDKILGALKLAAKHLPSGSALGRVRAAIESIERGPS